MTTLVVAPGLALPGQVVTERLAFLGRTGSGKTYAAQKLAEEMHRVGGQFIVLDPVGVWYGLRLAQDGRSPGLAVPVLGGLKGDIPLEAGAGAMIANLVVDRGVSVVLDVSQFESDADKARFAQAFADRFFFRKKAAPSAVHLFIEEAQEFVPQNPQREEARMLHAFTRMVKIGRNFGIGISLISQRPQEVNKKVLNLTELLFAFQLTGPQERKTLQGWIAEKGLDEDIAGELPKLDVGHPHVWSPAWLKLSKVVAIGRKATFDASSTPRLGRRADTRALSPIDLERLRVDMAATIEKAKADDPKELRRRIAELERRKPEAPASLPVERIRRVEVPALAPRLLQRMERLAAKMIGEAATHGRAMALYWGEQEKCWQAVIAALRAVQQAQAAPPSPPVTHYPLRPGPLRPTPATAVTVTPIHRAGALDQKILDALAWWKAAGEEFPRRQQVAFVAGRTIGGHFNNVVSHLHTRHLIAYPAPNRLTLTEAGAAQAHAHAPATQAALIDMIRGILGADMKRQIFDILVDVGKPITREELSQRVGRTVGGHFNNMVSRLSSLGIVAYPSPGMVGLSDLVNVG